MILVAAFWGTQFCLEDMYCRGRLTWHSSDKYNSRTPDIKCHVTDNSYTMAVRDLLIYTPKARGHSQRAAGVYIYIYATFTPHFKGKRRCISGIIALLRNAVTRIGGSIYKLYPS